MHQGCEQLGAGEILLNCIDKDGTNSGFDLELINLVWGGGFHVGDCPNRGRQSYHFVEVFQKTPAEAALAAGIFHRREVPISEVSEATRQGHMFRFAEYYLNQIVPVI